MRVRPARTYQHPNSAIRLMADYTRVRLKRDLKACLSKWGALVDTKEVARLIRDGRLREIHGLIDWNHAKETLKAPFDRIATLYEGAADLGVQRINRAFRSKGRRPRFKKAGQVALAGSLSLGGSHGEETATGVTILEKDVGDSFNFDRFAPSTQAALRTMQDQFIVDLSDTARATIESIILQGQFAGETADQIAEDIRLTIGLTASQAKAVLNYRSMLENLDPQALTRQLSSDAADAALQSAIDSGVSLDQATIDQMVADYESNYLDYRALTIAGTESVRASNLGLMDSYQQAIDRGLMPMEAVTKTWQVAMDEKTCPTCLSIPDMNPDGVAFDEDFQSDDGPVSMPPIHPSCRCDVSYITNLDMIPDEETLQ